MRLPFLLLALPLFAACSSDPDGPAASGDAGTDSAIPVEHDDPCGPDPTGLSDTPIPSTRVATWRAKKAIASKAGPGNPAYPGPLATYVSQGYGDVEKLEGEKGTVNETLLPGAGTSEGKAGRKSIAFIAQLSDFQLVDDESPTRLGKFDTPTAPGAARPAESMLGIAVSSMHRTLGKIAKSRPFDFEIVTGDCADSAQENEIGWFVDLMDGKAGLHLDSGDDDDPVVGPGNDPKDPFNPVAAPAPWYFVFGNHDVEIVGISTPDDTTKAIAVGTEPKNGTRDYRLKGAPMTQESIPADPRRRPLVRGEIVQAMQKSPTAPAGHGFGGITVSTPQANYTVDPVAGAPIRLIQLDTNDPYGGSDGLVLPDTVADLEKRLKQAASDKKIVILASHHSPTDITTKKGFDGAVIPGALDGAALEKLVASYPNVVMWLVGHSHVNRVRAIKGESADAPGYYEVMTDAIADWPSQARAIELVTLPDGTMSIYLSMVEAEARTCLEDRFRKWSLIDVTSGWSPDGSGSLADRNVELRRVLPTGVAIDGIGKDKIETETTLVGK